MLLEMFIQLYFYRWKRKVVRNINNKTSQLWIFSNSTNSCFEKKICKVFPLIYSLKNIFLLKKIMAHEENSKLRTCQLVRQIQPFSPILIVWIRISIPYTDPQNCWIRIPFGSGSTKLEYTGRWCKNFLHQNKKHVNSLKARVKT